MRNREREHRRLALQSTAELWHGLDILDAALKQGQFQQARDIVHMLRAVVTTADACLVDYLKHTPTQGEPK